MVYTRDSKSCAVSLAGSNPVEGSLYTIRKYFLNLINLIYVSFLLELHNIVF